VASEIKRGYNERQFYHCGIWEAFKVQFNKDIALAKQGDLSSYKNIKVSN